MGVFRSDDNYIYLDIPYCEFYIPMEYFESAAASRRFAEDFNDRIEVLGIFNVGIFENGGKLKELKTLNMPTRINIYVYDSEVRDVTLSNGEIVKCKVIKYLKNAKIMQSSLFEDDENAKSYLEMLTHGNVPNIVPYSKMLHVWLKNQKLNGVNFGLPSLYLEVVLSTLNRNPSDLSQKFSKIASDSNVSDYGYASATIRQICQYNSTFTALTYEDIDSMITSSLNKSRDKVKEVESPVEQIIKF